MKVIVRGWFISVFSKRSTFILVILAGLLAIAFLRVDDLRQVYLQLKGNHYFVEVIGHPNEELYNKEWINKRNKLINNHNASKVFMFSYMRGGSSIGGELFNCDSSATMWYEPGDAFFAHFYGLYHENIPQDDLYFSNFTRRKLGKRELQEMTEFYTNKFSCNYQDLPEEAMTHYFLSESTAMDKYVACRRRHQKQFYGNINRCSAHVKSVCSPNKVEVSLKNRCPDYISTTRRFITEDGVQNKSRLITKWLEHLKKENSSTNISKVTITNLKNFISHGLCVEQIKQENKKCLSLATSKCLKDKIRVVQVNRMKMEDLEPLLRNNPDMYVIHYVRDPRAIAVSRIAIRKLTWHPNERQPIGEARFLCQRIRADLRHRRRLSMKYPGAITQIRYEDLAINPKDTAKKIYSIFGRVPTKRWAEFVAKHMHAPKDGGGFGISVRNATETTRKWRKKIPPDQLQSINRICADVIHALGYSM